VNLIYNIKIFLSNLLSFLIIPFFRKKHSTFNDKILIINTEKLGDLIISSDFLYSLSLKNKATHFHILLNEYYQDLFNWSVLGFSPLSINKNKYRYNLIYRFRIILAVRRNKYKAVINITQERGMINDELSLVSGAKKITAMKKDTLYIPSLFLRKNNTLYDEVFCSVSSNEYLRLREYLVKGNIELVSGGKTLFRPAVFQDLNIDPGYIVIAPMTSEMHRSWGLNNYRNLCGNIGGNIILVGAKDELSSLEFIKAGRDNIKILTGMNLSQISAIINKCRIFVGNDSGLTHMAHQIGKPLIAIIGGGKFGKFFPYKERKESLFLYNKLECFGCDWKCIYDKKYCLTEINVDQVLNSIDFLLNISAHK
jgi:ADP-heptose:LPS heptosyltransferase